MGLGIKLLAHAIGRFIRSGAARDFADRISEIKYRKEHPEEAREWNIRERESLKEYYRNKDL